MLRLNRIDDASYIRTKIVCTIGPSSDTPHQIDLLMKNGIERLTHLSSPLELLLKDIPENHPLRAGIAAFRGELLRDDRRCLCRRRVLEEKSVIKREAVTLLDLYLDLVDRDRVHAELRKSFFRDL